MGGLVFQTEDTRALYETLKDRGVTDFTQEPTDHFYGTDMGIRDPFGNAHPDPPAGEGQAASRGDGLTLPPSWDRVGRRWGPAPSSRASAYSTTSSFSAWAVLRTLISSEGCSSSTSGRWEVVIHASVIGRKCWRLRARNGSSSMPAIVCTKP